MNQKFIYFPEFTCRTEDVVKVFPNKNKEGGTYLYILNHKGIPNQAMDREYTKTDYDGVIEVLFSVAHKMP